MKKRMLEAESRDRIGAFFRVRSVVKQQGQRSYWDAEWQLQGQAESGEDPARSPLRESHTRQLVMNLRDYLTQELAEDNLTDIDPESRSFYEYCCRMAARLNVYLQEDAPDLQTDKVFLRNMCAFYRQTKENLWAECEKENVSPLAKNKYMADPGLFMELLTGDEPHPTLKPGARGIVLQRPIMPLIEGVLYNVFSRILLTDLKLSTST